MPGSSPFAAKDSLIVNPLYQGTTLKVPLDIQFFLYKLEYKLLVEHRSFLSTLVKKGETS